MEVSDLDKLYVKMKQVQRDCESKDNGCLMTLGTPTGSGKTRGLVHFAGKHLVDDPSFRLIFITDQKKNLWPDAFYDEVIANYVKQHSKFKEKAERQKYLDKHVVVLRSLIDSVERWISTDLPSGLDSQEITAAKSEVKRKYELYNVIHKIDDKDYKGYGALSTAEFKFRQAIWKKLAKDLNIDSPLNPYKLQLLKKYVLSKDTKISVWLRHYFPSINIENAQLIITSNAKAIRSYRPFFSTRTKRVCNEKVLKNVLIVLDEIDSMKPTITQNIIEDACRLKVHFLELFKHIHEELNRPQDNRSIALMKIFQEQDRYSKLKKQSNQLSDKFHLTFNYKNIDDNAQDNFIFRLADITVTKANTPWQSVVDLKVPQVSLSQKNLSRKQDSLNFYAMLRQVTSFINYFVADVGVWAVRYMQQENSRHSSIVNDLTIMDAMTTIYTDFFGLDESSSEFQALISVWESQQFQSKMLVQDQGDVISNRYLQKFGAQFFSMTDNPKHNLSTRIDAVLIQKTAEKFLLKLCRKNLVLGMSATVNLETVIGNFDFNYLREQLGIRLLDGRDYLPEETLKSLDVGKRCQEKGVRVVITETEGQSMGLDGIPGIQLILRKRLSEHQYKELDKQKVELLTQEFSQEIRAQPNAKDRDFVEQRYLKLFDSFIVFLCNKNLTSFLGLQTPLPRKSTKIGGNPMRLEFIQSVFDGIEDLLGIMSDKKPQLRVISKNSFQVGFSIEQQLADALALPEKYRTRVYLLSAYNSIGVGQNLNHRLSDFEKPLVISIASKNVSSKDQRQFKVDLAGVYLGNVTQIFENVDAIHEMTPQTIHYLLQLSALVDNGEISVAKLTLYLQRLNRRIPEKQFQTTMSYAWAYTRTILQALGRMDRTFNKLPTLQIVVDTKVMDKFNVYGLKDYQLDVGAKAIQMYRRQKKVYQESTPLTIRYRGWNELIKKTYKTVVEGWVAHLQKDPKQAHRYQKLREDLLVNPTLYQRQYRKFELKAGYEFLPIPEKSYKVFRRGNEFSFEKQANVKISADAANLPSILAYPKMWEYFIANHWATEWKKRDYIMNPIHFDSYLGILGEKAGQFILKDIWSIEVERLAGDLNELFDGYIIGTHTLVDFKNWHQVHSESLENERKNVANKLGQICQKTNNWDWKVLFVNLVNSEVPDTYVQRSSNHGKILEVPGLIDCTGKLALSLSERKQLGEFVND
ncbi:hypothetical protein [Lactiplantibacillus songbeiensis]|uniref:Helicase ATP-binding domain-containing protein n=1 Tax=Lactiplantibacillus songbeiensis TaxID=2559920 RepID=A0ABW4BZY9_9LACO|nr:hypothetical protein [Lactiplantibacillus songbeiensis]